MDARNVQPAAHRGYRRLRRRAGRLWFARLYFALRYYRSIGRIIPWLWRSREVSNYTYDLTEDNKRYLASMVTAVTGTDLHEIEGYIRELDSDETLRRHIAELTARGPARLVSDPVQHYGRRLGWYAFARALKPRVIVETGVDKGLGACVLAKALIENEREGHPGRYFGTDIDPSAGYLFKPPYSDAGDLLYGDSIQSLKTLGRNIDLFINDSDHSVDYEAREYQIVESALTPGAVILGDNAHVTSALLEFAAQTGREFLFFAERPKDHWYPGGGIGIAFRTRIAV